MKRLIVTLLFSCSISTGFGQDAISVLQSVFDNLMRTISTGQSPNTSGFDLWGLGGIGGTDRDWTSYGIDIVGGSGAFNGEGGMFNGGIMGKFAQLMGFDEIHNDGSLNSNITWAILHQREIASNIKRRQDKIMSKQDTINARIYQLYLLEKKTQDYLNTTQNDAVGIEDMSYVVSLYGSIVSYWNGIRELKDKDPAINNMYNRITLKIANRSVYVKEKIQEFARRDPGDKNLLNNQKRDAVIQEVVEVLREMHMLTATTYEQCNLVQYTGLLDKALK